MVDNSSTDPKDIDLWILLTQAQHAVLRVREMDLKAAGLTDAQAGLLHVIRNEDVPPIQANVAKFVFREPHTVFSTVKTMEKKGLIKRRKDTAKKGNRVIIEITKKGEEAYQRSRQNVDVITEIMDCLSEKQKDQLRKNLSKVRDAAFQKLGKPSF